MNCLNVVKKLLNDVCVWKNCVNKSDWKNKPFSKEGELYQQSRLQQDQVVMPPSYDQQYASIFSDKLLLLFARKKLVIYTWSTLNS